MIHQGENSVSLGKLYGRNLDTDEYVLVTDFSNLSILLSLQDTNKSEVALLEYTVDANSNIIVCLPKDVTTKIVGKFYLEVIIQDSTTKDLVVSDTLGDVEIKKSTGGKKYGSTL